MSSKHAINLAKNIKKQTIMKEGASIKWDGRDFQFYKLLMRKIIFEEKELRARIDIRTTKRNL